MMKTNLEDQAIYLKDEIISAIGPEPGHEE